VKNTQTDALLEQAKENADDLLQQKVELEKEHKALLESATEKDRLLQAKVKSIGNYVHDSVPISDNEVINASVWIQLPLCR
jgi:seryl-tRNA synthetase